MAASKWGRTLLVANPLAHSGEGAEAADALEQSIAALSKAKDIGEESAMIRDDLLGKMAALRKVCDEAEPLTAKKYWPYPTYADLLFGVK